MQNKIKVNYLYDFRKLRTLLKTAVFVAFDTETTGLDQRFDKIIEIGAVKFDATGVTEEYTTLINPNCHVPERASCINHITDDMLETAPQIQSVLPDFIKFIGENSILIAHNARFDVDFINRALMQEDIKPLNNIVVDTLRFSRQVYPKAPKYTQQSLASMLHIDTSIAHRATSDATVCMKLFLQMICDMQ